MTPSPKIIQQAEEIVESRTMLDAVRRQSLINDIAEALSSARAEVWELAIRAVPKQKEPCDGCYPTGRLHCPECPNIGPEAHNHARSAILAARDKDKE